MILKGKKAIVSGGSRGMRVNAIGGVGYDESTRGEGA
jgi:hypothetical protein